MKHAAKVTDITCVKPFHVMLFHVIPFHVMLCSEASGNLIDTKCVKPYLASDASVLHCSDALNDTYS